MNRIVLYVIVGAVLAGVLGFAYYAISPLFNTIRVDEALPGHVDAEEAAPEDTMAVAEEEAYESARSPIIDTPAHPASGFVRIVEADDKRYIRYEDLKTINGPDIFVYLAKDLSAEEFVDLGRVRATEGNVNYEIPASVTIAEYPYVLIWCKAFGVLFNYADISQL